MEKRYQNKKKLKTPKKPTLISQILKAKQTNKYIYGLIMRKQTTENKDEQKWNERFTTKNLDLKKNYTNTLIATKGIKLRNFQYKYIIRIIPTNKYLQKYGIGETALCDFCNMEIETTDHLFLQCMRTQ